jgi:RimJ/RimL family protein N-acetyltransferase
MPPLSTISDFHQNFPPDFCLETERVLLRPMQKQDAEEFIPIAKSKVLWKYFTKELNEESQLLHWVDVALDEMTACKRMALTIIEKSGGTICGSTSFGNISFFDRRIEIGWTWLGEAFLGSCINRHAKFALLRHAFEAMHFERVEIKTDFLNERARRALVKIGAKEEGVLRSHMEMPHGRRRDSIYYSILKSEWNEVKFGNFHDLII